MKLAYSFKQHRSNSKMTLLIRVEIPRIAGLLNIGEIPSIAGVVVILFSAVFKVDRCELIVNIGDLSILNTL